MKHNSDLIRNNNIESLYSATLHEMVRYADARSDLPDSYLTVKGHLPVWQRSHALIWLTNFFGLNPQS